MSSLRNMRRRLSGTIFPLLVVLLLMMPSAVHSCNWGRAPERPEFDLPPTQKPDPEFDCFAAPEQVCHGHGKCANIGRGYECQCNVGWNGPTCESAEDNPPLLYVSVPASVDAINGDDVTLQCAFESDVPVDGYELIWIAEYTLPGYTRIQNTTLYRGLIDAESGEAQTLRYDYDGAFCDYTKYSRVDGTNLVVQDYTCSNAREFCCLVTIQPSGGTQWKTAKGCTTPKFIDFPPTALTCKRERAVDIVNGSTINVFSEEHPTIRAVCHYGGVIPRFGLVVYKISNGHKQKIAQKEAFDAMVKDRDIDYETRYSMTIDIDQPIFNTTTFLITTFGSVVTRTFNFTVNGVDPTKTKSPAVTWLLTSTSKGQNTTAPNPLPLLHEETDSKPFAGLGRDHGDHGPQRRFGGGFTDTDLLVKGAHQKRKSMQTQNDIPSEISTITTGFLSQVFVIGASTIGGSLVVLLAALLTAFLVRRQRHLKRKRNENATEEAEKETEQEEPEAIYDDIYDMYMDFE